MLVFSACSCWHAALASLMSSFYTCHDLSPFRCKCHIYGITVIAVWTRLLFSSLSCTMLVESMTEEQLGDVIGGYREVFVIIQHDNIKVWKNSDWEGAATEVATAAVKSVVTTTKK